MVDCGVKLPSNRAISLRHQFVLSAGNKRDLGMLWAYSLAWGCAYVPRRPRCLTDWRPFPPLRTNLWLRHARPPTPVSMKPLLVVLGMLLMAPGTIAQGMSDIHTRMHVVRHAIATLPSHSQHIICFNLETTSGICYQMLAGQWQGATIQLPTGHKDTFLSKPVMDNVSRGRGLPSDACMQFVVSVWVCTSNVQYCRSSLS